MSSKYGINYNYYTKNIRILEYRIQNIRIMSSKNDNGDFECFSLKYGTEVNELLSYFKDTEYKNAINIFRRDMSGDILEEFIFANVKVNN